MKKFTKILLIVSFIILENIALWYLAGFSAESVAHRKIIESRKGQVAVCESVVISENLFSTLEKMKGFTPTLSLAWFSPDSIVLSYGSESTDWSGGPGVALIFDKNMQLTHKSCDSKWEPAVPGFPPGFRE